jgi:hypothetical protein
MEKNYSVTLIFGQLIIMEKIILKNNYTTFIISNKENLIHQIKGNKVFPPYKTLFLELATPFLSNIIKTPEQSCSTIEFWSRAAPE